MMPAIAALALLAPGADDAAPEQPIEPALAARTFVDACWRGLRHPDIFHAAIAASPLQLRPASAAAGREHYRSPQADIEYLEGGCFLTIVVRTEEEANRYVDGITERLGLRPPDRAWVSERFMTAGFGWRDVPVDQGVYRFRGQIVHPAPKDRPGTYRIDIWLIFWSEGR